MSNPLKDLRKQLKNIVQDLLPSMLTEELHKAQYAKLSSELQARMDSVERHVKETMHEMNNRNKDVQSYLVRQVTAPKQE